MWLIIEFSVHEVHIQGTEFLYQTQSHRTRYHYDHRDMAILARVVHDSSRVLQPYFIILRALKQLA